MYSNIAPGLGRLYGAMSDDVIELKVKVFGADPYMTCIDKRPTNSLVCIIID